MILIDTIAGSDAGVFMRRLLADYPDSHVIGYAGDLDKFCALEEAMRVSMVAPKRFGLRCAHLGEHGYDGAPGNAPQETTEHPSMLPHFDGIRVKGLAHMNEVVRAISAMRTAAGGTIPISFAAWLADRENLKANIVIGGDEVAMVPPPPETEPELPVVH